MKKIPSQLKRSVVVAGITASVVFAAPFYLTDISSDGVANAGLFTAAYAAEEGGKGVMGAGGPGDRGQQGAGGAGGQGGKKGIDKVLEADDESDRPPWAQGNRDENPHAQGGGQPPEAGDKKGDEYGDLWTYVRDPVTGLPVTVTCDPGTCYQVVVCADAECTSTEIFELSTDPEAELPAGVVPLEVDLGRLNLGRSPAKVTDQAEEEALSKLTADGVSLSLDPAGRIMVDALTTIDSPRENLAIYIGIMTGDEQMISALEPLADTEAELQALAASLLAGAADKTGEINDNVVFYTNLIYDLVPADAEYVDYSALDYVRSTTFNDTVTYQELNADGTTAPVTGSVYDFVFGGVELADTDGGIDAFAALANDALQVIEFIHEPIHDLLP
jgi:hypothetical protein